MYCVTSYLPHNLMLNILPSIHTWLQGNSKTTELSRLNGAKIYQISLQLRYVANLFIVYEWIDNTLP